MSKGGEDSRIQDIEQQLAYLQWRKRRNERAIRDTLEATKLMKQKDIFMNAMSGGKAAWRNDVAAEEETKPLALTDEQVAVLTNIRVRSPGRVPWSPPQTSQEHHPNSV